jgi:hypothetical protein
MFWKEQLWWGVFQDECKEKKIDRNIMAQYILIGMPIKANVPMILFINTHKDVHIVMQIRLVL